MSDSWDDYASEWDTNKDAITYAKNAFSALEDYMQLRNLRIFDFGAGTGLLTERLAPVAREIVALDTSEKMLTVLESKELPNVKAISGMLTDTLIETNPLLQEPFDLIVASSVFGFLEDYELTLAMLRTLLTEGGSLVQWDWLASESQPDFGFSEQRVIDSLNQAGYKDVTTNKPFIMKSTHGEMRVIMGMGKR